MTAHNIKSRLTAAALLAAILALAGYQSLANRPDPAPSGPSQSTIVATFDLEKTFNTIDSKKAAFAEIPKLADKLQADSDAKRKELDKLSEDLKIHIKGSAKYNEIEEKLALGTQQFRAHAEFAKIKIEAEKGRALKRTYLEIRKAVQEVAKEHNYGLVLVDDSAAEIPPGTLDDLNRQISARRVVYTDVDITDEIIEHMNAAFKKAGGVVPATPAPAADAKPAKP